MYFALNNKLLILLFPSFKKGENVLIKALYKTVNKIIACCISRRTAYSLAKLYFKATFQTFIPFIIILQNKTNKS